MSKQILEPKIHKTILSLLCILLIGTFTFYHSFSLGLYGDEWQMLWFAKAAKINPDIVGEGTIWGAYGIEMTTFDFISNYLGYNGKSYYILSFISRLTASFAVLWFLLRRGMVLIAATIGSLIFMVSPIGIEATDWARNFDSYLGITLLLVCLDSLLKLKNLTWGLLYTFLVLLLLLINPLRSHGNILVLITVMCGLFLKGEVARKKILSYLVTVAVLFFLLIRLNTFGALTDFSIFLNIADFQQIIKSFLVNVSRIIIPSFGYQPLFFILISLIFIYWKWDVFIKFGVKVLIPLLLPILFISHKLLLNPDGTISLMLVGIFFESILIVTLALELRQKSPAFIQTLTIFAFLNAYIFFPALRQPDFRAASEHRYLIYSALVTPFIFAGAVNKLILQQGFLKYLPLSGAILIVIIFSYFSFNYLKLQNNNHGYTYSENIWRQITSQVREFDFKNKRAGVVIVNEAVDSSRVDNSVKFGFGYHMGLTHGIWVESMLPYLVIEDKKRIGLLFNGGDETIKYFGRKNRVPKENIIVLKITGDRVERLKIDDYLNDYTK